MFANATRWTGPLLGTDDTSNFVPIGNESSREAGARRFGAAVRVIAIGLPALLALAGAEPLLAGGDDAVARVEGDALASKAISARARDRPVLTFHPPRGGARLRTTTGSGWRHDFDIVLTSDADARVVFDEHGELHRFVPAEGSTASRSDAAASASRFLAHAGTKGELRAAKDQYRWTRTDGTQVTFAGSVPIRMTSPSGRVRELRYGRGRLRSVHDTERPTLIFAHRSGRLDELFLSDGTRWKIARDGLGRPIPLRDDTVSDCPASPPAPLPDTDTGAGERDDRPIDDPEDSACDTDASPPTPAFERAAGIPGALRIDARPASCRSYFSDFVGTERGTAIERGLGDLEHYGGYTATVRSFPVADFVGGELRIVRSRDLSLPTYDARGDGLLNRLLADGEEIERRLLEPLERQGRLELRELGRTTTLVHEPGRPVVLELVVRHGLASADQVRQIERARAVLLARHGIILRVIEIP